jgi:uncharacterized membrane protein
MSRRQRLYAALQHGLKVNLLAGLLTLMPVVATVWFLHLLITWVDKTLLLLPRAARPENFLPFPVPGLGLILVLAVLFLSGLLVRNFLGRRLVALGDRIVSYIPLVSKVYRAVKQLVETIFQASGKEFKRVVLVEYPRKGVYALAYVTGVATGEIQRRTDKRVINLFLPTTPNPTSGFYLMVPEEEVIPLDMSVEDSFKVLMSGGILNPEVAREKSKAHAADATTTPKEANQ